MRASMIILARLRRIVAGGNFNPTDAQLRGVVPVRPGCILECISDNIMARGTIRTSDERRTKTMKETTRRERDREVNWGRYSLIHLKRCIGSGSSKIILIFCTRFKKKVINYYYLLLLIKNYYIIIIIIIILLYYYIILLSYYYIIIINIIII